MWLRYTDDTTGRWASTTGPHELNNCFNTVYSKRKENQLAFFDVKITHTEHRFKTPLYQKPTFAGQYVNLSSYHLYSNKKWIVCCLISG